MAPLPPDSTSSKRRRLDRPRSDTRSKDNMIPWRSEWRRRIYSAKLVEALFRARNTAIASSREDSANSSGWGGVLGEVKGIADRVLATEAKGRTRWSRAILTNRVRVNAPGKRRHMKGGRLVLPAVERRVKVLGRLVPGCRGISVTSLLEEASDYIAALEMQVKAMTALSQLLGAPAVRSSTPVNDDVDDVSLPSARC